MGKSVAGCAETFGKKHHHAHDTNQVVALRKRNETRGVKKEAVVSFVLPTVKSEALSDDEELGSNVFQTRGSEPVNRPTADQCHLVTIGLAKLHPHVVDRCRELRAASLESCGMRNSITDSLVSTMLSQNTTDANAKAAFKALKKDFPTWDKVASSEDTQKLMNAIRVAGLAKTRAVRIRSMLRTVKEERGIPCFDYLRDLTAEEAKKELMRFKGIGPKTISCVLLFTLSQSEFPVDTHVLRISKMLKWVPSHATREAAYRHLNAVVPDALKMELHCLLVTHGKQCHKCAANGKPQFPPKGGKKLVCPLVDLDTLTPKHMDETRFEDDEARQMSQPLKQGAKSAQSVTGVKLD